jgi:hypothetical protein
LSASLPCAAIILVQPQLQPTKHIQSDIQMNLPANHDVFVHIRLIIGMVISLAMARLLNGIAKFVQHPKKIQIYPVHIGWVLTVLLFLVHFWWWEFHLIDVVTWTFEAYLLIISYAITFFFLSTILFPDHMEEYSGYKDYFTSRQRWFFAILASTFIIDLLDGFLKGNAYVLALGPEMPIRNCIYFSVCLAAMFIRNAKFQLAFVSCAFLYELSWIFRLYHTVQ